MSISSKKPMNHTYNRRNLRASPKALPRGYFFAYLNSFFLSATACFKITSLSPLGFWKKALLKGDLGVLRPRVGAFGLVLIGACVDGCF